MKRFRILFLIIATILLAWMMDASGKELSSTPHFLAPDLLSFMMRVDEISLPPENSSFPDILPYADRKESMSLSTRLIIKSYTRLTEFDRAIGIVSGYRNLYVVQYGNYADAMAAKQKFETNSSVSFVEYDYSVQIMTESLNLLNEHLSWGYGVNYLSPNGYWNDLQDRNLALHEVIVAVIDTGIDMNHPFLAGRIHPNGYDFVNLDGEPDDDHFHGTHVSGIIVDGTPSTVKILPLKTLDQNGSGTMFDAMLAIYYAIEQGAKIINMSFGGEGIAPYMDDAVNAAYEAGVISVAAAGNSNRDARSFSPANIENAITVAAIAPTFQRPLFSNYGPRIDVSAPGFEIVSSVPGGRIESHSGTSMAAPHVAAVAANLLMVYPTLTPNEIDILLKDNAIPIAEPGMGAGMVTLSGILPLRPSIRIEALDTTFYYLEGTLNVVPIRVIVYPESSSLVFSTSDSNVATITHNRIQLHGPGKATLTISTSTLSKKIDIQVLSIGSWYQTQATELYIRSRDDLLELAEIVNQGLQDFEGRIISLDADVNLNGLEWRPIGTPAHPFAGTFDGHNHTISNLTYTAFPYDFTKIGLFGETSSTSTLANLRLVNMQITNNTGQAHFYIGGIAGTNRGRIVNASVDGDILVYLTFATGGIAGVNYGTIEASINNASISAIGVNGGIVGENLGLIVNNVNYAQLNGISMTGGIAGINRWTGRVLNNLNHGNILSTIPGGSTNLSVGGIVGYCNGIVTNNASLGIIDERSHSSNIHGTVAGELWNANLLHNYGLAQNGLGFFGYRNNEDQTTKFFGNSEIRIIDHIAMTTEGLMLADKMNEFAYAYNEETTDSTRFGRWTYQHGVLTITPTELPISDGYFITERSVYHLLRGKSIEIVSQTNRPKAEIVWIPKHPGIVEVIDDRIHAISEGSIEIDAWLGSNRLSTIVVYVHEYSWHRMDYQPMTISTVEQWNELAEIVNYGMDDFNGKTIRLANNLDFSGHSLQSIGQAFTMPYAFPFQGRFDGNDFVIYNATIHSKTAFTGIFSVIGEHGIIHNVELDRVKMVGPSKFVGAIAGLSYGTLQNVKVQGFAEGDSFVGGLVGQNNGRITNAIVDVKLFGYREPQFDSYGNIFMFYFGGVTGLNRGRIENIAVFGEIENYESTLWGAVVGWNDGFTGQGIIDFVYYQQSVYFHPVGMEVNQAITQNLSAFDDSWILSEYVIINANEYSTLFEALNAWAKSIIHGSDQYFSWSRIGGHICLSRPAKVYTVRFVDWDNTVLKEETLTFGSIIVAPIVDLNRPSSKLLDYKFVGFQGYESHLTILGNVTFEAEYATSPRMYQIRFLNWDGAVLFDFLLGYGEYIDFSTINAVTPFKDSDVESTYRFIGWTPAVNGTVIGAADYVATYEAIPRNYTYRFFDEKGNVLMGGVLAYGSVIPVPVEPNNHETMEFRYVFIGYQGYEEGMHLTEDIDFYPVYESIRKQYTIRLFDESGLVWKKYELDYGTQVNISEGPYKSSQGLYDYEFDHFDGLYEGFIVRDHVDFYPVYREVKARHLIRLFDIDGSIWIEFIVNNGEPIFLNDLPSIVSLPEYRYVFIGYVGYIHGMNAYHDHDFYAEYLKVRVQYTYRFFDALGQLMTVTKADYGTRIVMTEPSLKSEDAVFRYVFIGYQGYEEGMLLTEDIDFYPVYESIRKQYTIRFFGDNQELLSTRIVESGSIFLDEWIPEATKPSSYEFFYRFLSWDIETPKYVFDNLDFSAIFEAYLPTFTIRFLNDDLEVLYTLMGTYRTTVPNVDIQPVRSSTSQYIFIFDKWSEEIPKEFYANIDLVATYRTILQVYTITYYDHLGNIWFQTNQTYGAPFVFPFEGPGKSSDFVYDYKFIGWSPSILEFVQDHHNFYPLYRSDRKLFDVHLLPGRDTIHEGEEWIDAGIETSNPNLTIQTISGWDSSLPGIYFTRYLISFQGSVLTTMIRKIIVIPAKETISLVRIACSTTLIVGQKVSYACVESNAGIPVRIGSVDNTKPGIYDIVFQITSGDQTAKITVRYIILNPKPAHENTKGYLPRKEELFYA